MKRMLLVYAVLGVALMAVGLVIGGEGGNMALWAGVFVIVLGAVIGLYRLLRESVAGVKS